MREDLGIEIWIAVGGNGASKHWAILSFSIIEFKLLMMKARKNIKKQ